jgi:hypothetical protein
MIDPSTNFLIEYDASLPLHDGNPVPIKEPARRFSDEIKSDADKCEWR